MGEITNIPERSGPSIDIEEVIVEKLSSKPSLYGIACGHGIHRLTLPLGCRALLDASARMFVIEEEALS